MEKPLNSGILGGNAFVSALLRRPHFWLPIPISNFGGGGEIRTHGPVAQTPVFKTGALDHSATPPKFFVYIYYPQIKANFFSQEMIYFSVPWNGRSFVVYLVNKDAVPWDPLIIVLFVSNISARASLRFSLTSFNVLPWVLAPGNFFYPANIPLAKFFINFRKLAHSFYFKLYFSLLVSTDALLFAF